MGPFSNSLATTLLGRLRRNFRAETGADIRHTKPQKRRVRRFEQLEERIVLDATAPDFLFQWEVRGREFRANVSTETTEYWGFVSTGLSDQANVDSGPHAFQSFFVALGEEGPVPTRPSGTTQTSLQASNVDGTAVIEMTSNHLLTYQSATAEHSFLTNVFHDAVLTVFVRHDIGTSFEQTVTVNSDYRIESNVIEASVFGKTGDVFIPVFGDTDGPYENTIQYSNGVRPLEVQHNGSTYFPLIWKTSYQTASSYFARPPFFYEDPLIGPASVNVEYSSTVTVTIRPPAPSTEAAVRAVAQVPSVLGLGNALVLDGRLSAVEPPGAAQITDYRWFIAPADTPNDRVLLGNGAVLEVGYTAESAISELGEFIVTLEVTDSRGESASQAAPLSIQMNFLDYVFHGGIPTASQVDNTREVFSSYARQLNRFATSGQIPATSSHDATAVLWDSVSGFTLAMVTKLASLVSLTLPNPITALLAHEVFSDLYRQMLRVAQYQAELAARATAGEIARRVTILPPGDASSYAIHLIGHSRGGYVASRTSELLDAQHGIEVCYLTVMDGYGSDWPGFASSFADGSIVDTATATFGNNFRVEEDLLQFGAASLGRWFADEIAISLRALNVPFAEELIASIVDSDIVDTLYRLIGSAEWKAPTRPAPFGDNTVVVGNEILGRSNHINIHEYYFGSPDSKPNDRVNGNVGLLLNGPLGNPSACVPNTPAMAPLTLPTSPGPIDFSSLNLGITAADLLSALNSKEAVREYLEQFPATEYWLEGLQTLVLTDGFLEATLFGSENALLDTVDDGRAALRVFESTVIALPNPVGLSEAVELAFVIEVPGPGTAGIRIDGVEVARLPLETAGNVKVMFDLPATDEMIQDLTFEFPEEMPGDLASLLLTSLEFLPLTNAAIFQVQPAVGLLGGDIPASLTVESFGMSPADSVTQVSFFRRDASDIATNGLVSLGEGAWSDGIWSLDFATDSLGVGTHYFLARLDWSDGSTTWHDASYGVATLLSDRTNYREPLDVNRDGRIDPTDALAVLTDIANRSRFFAEPADFSNTRILPDVNGDRRVEPLDALLILNHIRRQQFGAMLEGEGSTATRGLVPGIEHSPQRDRSWQRDEETTASQLESRRASAEERLQDPANGLDAPRGAMERTIHLLASDRLDESGSEGYVKLIDSALHQTTLDRPFKRL